MTIFLDYATSVSVENNQAKVSITNNTKNATVYKWSFPNGTPSSSTEKNPEFVYTQNGSYVITLTASNETETDSKTEILLIDEIPKNVKKRTFDLKDFKGVKLSSVFNVNISIGDVFLVEATGTEELIDHLDFRLDNDKLSLNFEENYNTNLSVDVVVNITMPSCVYIENRSAGSFEIHSAFSEQDFEIISSGSGPINFQKNIDLSGQMKIENTGSGDVDLKGESDSFSVNNSGSGNTTGYYSSVTTVASAYGSGNIYITSTGTLNATISGSGSIYYKGKPTITKSITGSGNLVEED